MYFSLAVAAGLLALAQDAFAYSRIDLELKRALDQIESTKTTEAAQIPRRIVFPPKPTNTGIKRIPDAAHPFIAPGPNDMRGPCPALNTLANHGYIPRNGIVTPEQAIMGVTEGFNIEHDFSVFLGSLATLARGNANIGKFSIGLSSPQVPALPGKIDGPTAGGIGKHGRFEGDVSISRHDAALGDSVHFQEVVFDQFILYVGKYGEDGPDGPMSVVTDQAFTQFKTQQYNQDRAEDPLFSFQPARVLSTFNEVAQVLELFSNGTDGKLSINAMASIFRNQTFAPNWFRRASPGGFPELSSRAGKVRGDGTAFPAGEKVNGVFQPNPNDITGPKLFCVAYEDTVANNVAGVLLNTTGILRQNVNTLLDGIFNLFHEGANCTKKATPVAPPETK